MLVSAGNVKRERIQKIKRDKRERGENVDENEIAENLPEQEVREPVHDWRTCIAQNSGKCIKNAIKREKLASITDNRGVACVCFMTVWIM